MVVFGEFDWQINAVFCVLKYQDDVQDGSNNIVGNHMVFTMIHCTEKIIDSYFSLCYFFGLRFGNSIHQSIHHFSCHLWLDLIIHTIIVPTLGKHSVQKMKRYMPGYTQLTI